MEGADVAASAIHFVWHSLDPLPVKKCAKSSKKKT